MQISEKLKVLKIFQINHIIIFKQEFYMNKHNKHKWLKKTDVPHVFVPTERKILIEQHLNSKGEVDLEVARVIAEEEFRKIFGEDIIELTITPVDELQKQKNEDTFNLDHNN